MKKVLILAPHTDDAEFGCGGAIAKWIRLGYEVKVIAFSYVGRNDLFEEMNEAMGELGVKEFKIHNYQVRNFNRFRQRILDDMIKEDRAFNPDLVVCPATTDQHQDHQVNESNHLYS